MSGNLQIELQNIEKHYGSYHALRNINLSIPKGQFVALVGPSGCGKSTLLRSIAGLESISGGTMKIAGEVVNGMPPRKRDLAMVFQSYALYPHMNVRDNLTYSLRLKRVGKAEANRAADEVAKITGLEKLLDRYPRELSGGQRQRVAMGRAIIRNPKAFLFDEPLSNLDAALRVHMRGEVRKLHDRLGATSVYVTHDQIEAMTMADHVVVLRDGVLEQQGAPLDLYDRPANRFVAGFIGSPAMNFVNGRIGPAGASILLELPNQPVLPLAGHYQPSMPVVAGLRPEHLSFCDSSAPGAFAMRISIVERTGSQSFVVMDTDPEIIVATPDRIDNQNGDAVHLRIDPRRIHIFDANTGIAVGSAAPPPAY
jgi:multiple sugar transport system ATP-binding protein